MKRKMRLSREEKAVEKSLESGEWVSAPKSEVAKHVKYAREFMRKHKKEGRINIRMATGDLEQIRRNAATEGLPYQTFMASILHKYVSGQLVDRKVVTELKSLIRSPKRTAA